MNFKEKIIKLLEKKKEIRTRDLVQKYGVSRQFASSEIHKLVQGGLLVKFGSTRSAHYCLASKGKSVNTISKREKNKNLEEHAVLESLQKQAPFLKSLQDNLYSIFYYAFSEMLNNAIDHSQSENIKITIAKNKQLVFHIDDFGIGVFRNIQKKKKLQSELESVQDLLKGKTTTQPQAHSGEGIFFTSKIADIFVLESFGYRLTIDNLIEDVFFEKIKSRKKGTKVTFIIDLKTSKHLNDLFRSFQADPQEHAFDKTQIQIKLYTLGTIHISRSQARRVLVGLGKFKMIVLDFDQVPLVGQAFADEIFRVFQQKHLDIQIIPINMNEAVQFMIERTQKSN